jgi:3-phenylpropionate/cinnamic acid dioxygenase small subunit
MIPRELFLSFTIFLAPLLHGQQFDLNNIKIDDVKNVLQGVLGKTEKTNPKWSGTAGDPNFNIADRIAIKDVIDSYGIYWDTNDLDSYLSLFTEDAVGVSYNNKGEKITVRIKDKRKMLKSKERMDYFESNNMQRRHMMCNTLILELNESSAHLKQYMMLLTTKKSSKVEIVTPIFYDFKLKKTEGIWKISYRQINLDAPLDLEVKP